MAALRGSVTQTNCPKTAIKVKYCYKVTSDIKRNPPKETICHLIWQFWLETALCTYSLGHQFWSNSRSFSKEPLRDPTETAIFPTETEIFPKLKSSLCSVFPCSNLWKEVGMSIFADFFSFIGRRAVCEKGSEGRNETFWGKSFPETSNGFPFKRHWAAASQKQPPRSVFPCFFVDVVEEEPREEAKLWSNFSCGECVVLIIFRGIQKCCFSNITTSAHKMGHSYHFQHWRKHFFPITREKPHVSMT